MPELPEVETMRRGILDVVGTTITAVRFPRLQVKPISVTPNPRTFQRRVRGREIVDVRRLGKRVVVHLDDQACMVFEPRMTGLVLVADPPGTEHLRVEFQLSGGRVGSLMYWDRRGLGTLRLLRPTELDQQLGPDKLGPDALTLTPKILRRQLESSRRAIKVALLDQKAVAGIGNLYASEILHEARIHPGTSCDQLTVGQWEAICRKTKKVLRLAIEHEGSTLSDGTYRNALNDPGGYQNYHRVYDRKDARCPTCRKGRVIRIVQAQRSTFYCPICQPPNGR